MNKSDQELRSDLIFEYCNKDYVKRGEMHPTFHWGEGFDSRQTQIDQLRAELADYKSQLEWSLKKEEQLKNQLFEQFEKNKKIQEELDRLLGKWEDTVTRWYKTCKRLYDENKKLKAGKNE